MCHLACLSLTLIEIGTNSFSRFLNKNRGAERTPNFKNRKEEPENQEGAVASRRARARQGGTTTSSPTAGANPRRAITSSRVCPPSPSDPAHCPQAPQRGRISRRSTPAILRRHPVPPSRDATAGTSSIAVHRRGGCSSATAGTSSIAGHLRGAAASPSAGSSPVVGPCPSP